MRASAWNRLRKSASMEKGKGRKGKKMINQEFKAMLSNKNVIRNMAEFAAARGKEIGYENVFDFSLGNPSTVVP